jgi:hypothetical protein
MYHEGTHAFLDLMDNDPAFQEFINSGRSYYGDSDHQFQEAVGDYVDAHVTAFLNAYFSLKHYLANGGVTDSQLNSVRDTYNRAMQQSQFGTVVQRSFSDPLGTEVSNTREISNQMRAFIDHYILEDRIPSNFDSVPTFREMLRR